MRSASKKKQHFG